MKEPNSQNIEIPIIIRNGRVEFLYGGPLPELKEGQVGSVQVPAFAFTNSEDVTRLSVTETITILPKDSALHIHLMPRGTIDLPSPLVHLQTTDNFWGSGGFALITLEEELRLTFHGTKTPAFEPSECHIPVLNRKVESINQAYTRLSEVYEKHRKTNTGNVFTKVFYLPKEATWWQPLDHLRSEYQAAFETKMFQAHGWLFGTT